MQRGRPKPITWKQLEREVRSSCADSGLVGPIAVVPWTADEERRAKARDHAYVYPSTLGFHFSAKTLALPAEHREAVVAHEVGHCLAQHHWGSSTEDEAEAAAQRWLGTRICYDHAWPGKGLQVTCARAKNPSFSSYDEALAWIGEGAKRYGGKTKFLASDEYRAAYPEIQRLHAESHGRYNPSAFVAPTSSTESDPGYVYHATNTENLFDIISAGKLVTHSPSYGTDQDEWPDGSRKKRSYWSTRADYVWHFAPDHGKAVIVRTTRTADFRDESTGDVYTTKPVPVERLEVLTQDGWTPLSRVSNPSRTRNPERQTRIARRIGV